MESFLRPIGISPIFGSPFTSSLQRLWALLNCKGLGEFFFRWNCPFSYLLDRSRSSKLDPYMIFVQKNTFKMAFAKYVNGMRDPPLPFMANAILNFHFCFWNPSLVSVAEHFKLVKNRVTFETHLKHSNIISGLKTN